MGSRQQSVDQPAPALDDLAWHLDHGAQNVANSIRRATFLGLCLAACRGETGVIRRSRFQAPSRLGISMYARSGPGSPRVCQRVHAFELGDQVLVQRLLGENTTSAGQLGIVVM